MQFAAQRTDMNLNPVGEPFNYLIKLSDDVLPDPDAVLITGITPQATISEGLTEAEFLKIFTTEIALPDTIFTGFNSVRFDDEFMRFLHYRNFYDPYEWQWKEGRSRWDILDLVRMTRALRPEGIKWPYDSQGQSACRLTLLTAINGLDHDKAHDALNDVQATIALARLVRKKQPKLFGYLLSLRDKKSVKELVNKHQTFVYTSGKYSGDCEKTTIVTSVANHPKRDGVLVYDLTVDPTPFLKMSPAELAEAWKYTKDETVRRVPVKTLQFNRCPAIAPYAVMDNKTRARLQISAENLDKNLRLVRADNSFADKLLVALEMLDKQQQASWLQDDTEVDAKLYDGFFNDDDKHQMQFVRSAPSQKIKEMAPVFKDDRLKALWPLYKARNFPKLLSDEDRQTWEVFRQRKLLGGKQASRAAKYFKRLSELISQSKITDEQRYLLEELQLYGQSILPGDQ